MEIIVFINFKTVAKKLPTILLAQVMIHLDLFSHPLVKCHAEGKTVVGVLTRSDILAALLAILFSRFLAEGRGLWTLPLLSLVLLYMLVKALLDFIFRMDFQRDWGTRLATLALMCLALFSLVWIAFSIHPSWGTPVLIAFVILAVNLIFMYRNEIRVRHAPHPNLQSGACPGHKY